MNGKNKIVHINRADSGEGSSLAALRLHTAMLNAGIDSTYLVFEKKIRDRKDIIEIKPNKYIRYYRLIVRKIFEKIKNLFTGKLNEKMGLFAAVSGYDDILKNEKLLDCDIIYIHGILWNCLSYGALEKLFALNKKTYWFLHDNFAFTGGCPHPFECEKYQTKCRKCQYWEGFSLFDCAKYEFDRKNKIISKADNLTFIAPSFWILNNAKKSAIAKNKNIRHIPNMVDPAIFKILDRDAARELFSIGNDKKVIGFGAAHALTNPYKGWEYMKDTFDILAKKSENCNDIEVLIFGCNYQKNVADMLPFKAHFLGYLSDEYSIAMMYNAMDVYVMPSTAENFPQAILESLACNVPVVAFDVGGIPDMVNENTGYLAKYKDSEDLATGIDMILSRTEKMDVRKYAEKYFTNSILQKHIKMWEDEEVI